MTKRSRQKLTLDQQATYQINVPGIVDERISDWMSGTKLTAGTDDNDMPVTTLVVTVDQAALHGYLRRLYSLGLPLISVLFIEVE